MRTLFLALALFAAPAAYACSVAPGYRVPTTLELVEQSDAIIVAQPFDQWTAADGEPQIRFASLAVLKRASGGNDGRDRIFVDIPGVLEPETSVARSSDPRELVRAHPEAYEGGCVRMTFHPKNWVLLFLRRDGDGYRAISYPFARTAEDTALPDSRWLKAVREYIAIAALPPAARRARMEVRRKLLRVRRDRDSRAIAADLDRELAGPRKPLREPLPPIE